MPIKIRELKRILRRAGFVNRGGKGSHTNWYHPRYPGRATVSGKDGNDAQDYQEAEVRKAIEVVERPS